MKTDNCNPVLKQPKYIEVKGLIVAFTAALVVISYLIYYYYFYIYEIELNELYFTVTGIGISVFTGLLFTFFQNLCVRTILLFTSTFYGMMVLIYIIVWIILGEPYTYIRASLIIGLVIGLIYVIYDSIANKPRTSD
jgi:hypothetical protein